MVIDPMKAVEEAKRSLGRPPLRDTPGIAGNPGTPLLVRRLDIPGQYYYLVPLEDQRGILLVVQVDGTTGAMSSAAVMPAPVPRLVMTPEEARDLVSDRLGKRVAGKPELVWQPCHESASPLQPLYSVPIENGDAFVGIDGSVYPGLTPFGKGG
jgi:hypothetical protein